MSDYSYDQGFEEGLKQGERFCDKLCQPNLTAKQSEIDALRKSCDILVKALEEIRDNHGGWNNSNDKSDIANAALKEFRGEI
jgi:hypothetical protein